MSSPAERYAAARRRGAHPSLSDFTTELGFTLDPFQVEACEALERGSGVLVCAPTGAGKTVVGEFAVHKALSEGRKAFYTTPIKALSNQKYTDLVDRYGTERVGLLTGDNAINGSAPVVVMTTEVLRNMLYADSPALVDLGYVVMDEVHYLADRFRGAVWEEVIIHLPSDVRLVSLSATVSNAEEFADWLVTVRGDTEVVVSEVRPIPLWQHMLVDNRVFDLFALRPAAHAAELELTPRGASTRERGAAVVDPELVRYVRERERRLDTWGGGGARGGGPGGLRGQGGGHNRPRHTPPARSDVIERLDRSALLPAITFVFSRVGCDAAVDQCLRSGLRLTDEGERREIAEIIDRRTGSLPEEDLDVLGFWEWREGLLAGLAAHHAGLVPAFKETVEECFVRGLVKAVFATETLALGINMPARTVVLERLVKWNGEAHVDVTPGEYTQLTGRAGRRGIDVEGHAVVVWAPGVDPTSVAGLASTRTYPLRSSFRPSYNMAVNLVGSFGRAHARDLLASSFAQFQADRSVVGLARSAAAHEAEAARFAAQMESDHGDVAGYARLRAEISDREKELSRDTQAKRRLEAAEALAALRTGDVIRVPTGRRQGLAVVLDPGITELADPRPLVLTEDKWAGRLGSGDFPTPVTALARVRVPKQFNHRSPHARRDLASTLRNARVENDLGARRTRQRSGASDDPVLTDLRHAVRAHPVHALPDREERVRTAERWLRALREAERLHRQMDERTGSLTRQFDRTCDVLLELGYLAPEPAPEPTPPPLVQAAQRTVHHPAEHPAGPAPTDVPRAGEDAVVTDDGRRLARIWSETDLLTAECLRAGVFTGLNAVELAACVSTLVFEARRDAASQPSVPSGRVAATIAEMRQVRSRLEDVERDHGVPVTRDLDLGFVWAAYRWADGQSLDRVLAGAEQAGTELSGGDFVRWARQLVDLLDQLAKVAGDPVARTARTAVGRVRRGVVAVAVSG
ncbi:DEAD/DEAH box helicase [Modestobacter sp. I12A-02628]|uniref:DEAD/DEAH box helicase n=1 Tax=Goekera deserti TaxID=2497753 RepID=A0A7K3WE17_9ACTN|nr:DEAD/DEAH box helicase [Goekera deserti]MPQ99650.1 DEAD/DEAH box helicase [Goekera deserti]NDI46340.1 DEAD/DEAH box helicase [Goekera deserti]NEL54728.1 DEAD/DEAH box helicase [Goekera deserti]